MAFAAEQLGRVNRGEVGGFAPETLLVVGRFEAKERKTGWNLFRHPTLPGLHRVADAAGRPPYPLADVAPADLMGVNVTESKDEPPADTAG
jgi:hypothetical protein